MTIQFRAQGGQPEAIIAGILVGLSLNLAKQAPPADPAWSILGHL